MKPPVLGSLAMPRAKGTPKPKPKSKRAPKPKPGAKGCAKPKSAFPDIPWEPPPEDVAKQGREFWNNFSSGSKSKATKDCVVESILDSRF